MQDKNKKETLTTKIIKFVKTQAVETKDAFVEIGKDIGANLTMLAGNIGKEFSEHRKQTDFLLDEQWGKTKYIHSEYLERQKPHNIYSDGPDTFVQDMKDLGMGTLRFSKNVLLSPVLFYRWVNK